MSEVLVYEYVAWVSESSNKVRFVKKVVPCTKHKSVVRATDKAITGVRFRGALYQLPLISFDKVVRRRDGDYVYRTFVEDDETIYELLVSSVRKYLNKRLAKLELDFKREKGSLDETLNSLTSKSEFVLADGRD